MCIFSKIKAKFIYMIKENLSTLANTSAVAGACTWSWSFLSKNSSEITMLIVILTFIVTAIAHFYDKKIKHNRFKIESKRVEIDVKRFEIEQLAVAANAEAKIIEDKRKILELEVEKLRLETKNI